jgi:hypothetical protein
MVDMEIKDSGERTRFNTGANLIDRDVFRQQIYSCYDCVNEDTSKENYRGETLMAYEVAGMIEECLENAPKVDAVPVVRCKDCDLWNKWDNNADFGCSCAHFSKSEESVCVVYTDPDDFCSRGVKKHVGLIKTDFRKHKEDAE